MSTSSNGLPCEVNAFLTANCLSCHGRPAASGVPFSLTSYQELSAAIPGSAQTVAQRALAEVQSGSMPPGRRLSSTETAAFAAWVQSGAASQSCAIAGAVDAGSPIKDAGAVDAGGAGDAGNPYNTPSRCTSNTRWTSGDRGSAQMHPGRACITCHTGGLIPRGPRFAFAGTLFPSAHEPDDCNGQNGSGVTIKLKGANGQTVTLTPNQVGNFYGTTSLTLPYTAEITYQGRTRSMLTPQTSGDCNSCHTEQGSNSAPGRIMLP